MAEPTFVEGRLVERVTYRGVTFRGLRFGVLPGSWIMNRTAALKIVKACECSLPRWGYDVALQSDEKGRPDFRYFLTRHGTDRLRLTVRDGYTHEHWEDK